MLDVVIREFLHHVLAVTVVDELVELTLGAHANEDRHQHHAVEANEEKSQGEFEGQ